MEQQHQQSVAATEMNHNVEEYVTSFQSEQLHQNPVMHNHLVQPSLQPYPIRTIKQSPANNTIQIDQQQQYNLRGAADLYEPPTPPATTVLPVYQTLNTYCNLRATSGNALTHHHYQQLPAQQQQQQQHMLMPQQLQRKQQQRHHQQHRQQPSLSQYPLCSQRGLAVANQHFQHYPNQYNQQQEQPQHHFAACSQFVDPHSYYTDQDNQQYLTEQVDNRADYGLGAIQSDENQILYGENNQPAAVANHLYSSSTTTIGPSKQNEVFLLDHHIHQQPQYHMSVNYSNFEQISNSPMSSPLNLYANDQQVCNQSPVSSSANSTLEQESQQDILDALGASDQAQYRTHLKADPAIQSRPNSGIDNAERIINLHNNQQHRKQSMTGYSGQSLATSVGAPLNQVQMQTQSAATARSTRSNQVQQQSSGITNNGNSPYGLQVMHVNYEVEPQHVKDSQNYVTAMNQQQQQQQRQQRSSTVEDIVMTHLPQQQQRAQRLQYVDSQAYYDSNRIVATNNSVQQQQQQPQQQQHHHQQLSTTGISTNNQPANSRALVDRPINRKQEDFVELGSNGSVSQDWLDTICRHLIDHMNRFGICVIDNFLGPLKGDKIFKEVLQLYTSGQHTRGGLVNSNKLSSRNLGADAGVIRNDRVIWIDGYEEGCSEINNLIQTLCSVITNSARLSLYSNNGLDKIVINKRTKAHVACYPGNGTRYIKHVDNPNGDGRVITAIYYLNKNWNTKQDGGLLRMFPTGINEVANIEPLFDRVLFFWSDRRNPHEVLPAYRDRFAITVWYIGENRIS